MAEKAVIPVLTERDFASLSGSADVKSHLRFITPEHRKACGCYLVALPVWLIFAGYGGYALDRAGLYPGDGALAALLLVAALLPLWPLFTVRRHMRRPVLDKLATLAGMDYASHDFGMKAFEEVRPILFGDKATSTFTDLLAGKEGGNSYAVCRADIDVDGEPVFAGLLHWFGRRARSGMVAAILPAGEAVAARAKLSKLSRVETGDSAFQIWSDDPKVAEAQIKEDFRTLLASFAGQGQCYAHIARNDAFLLSTTPAAFEPEDPPADREARLRLIFDAVAAAFRTGAVFRSQPP